MNFNILHISHIASRGSSAKCIMRKILARSVNIPFKSCLNRNEISRIIQFHITRLCGQIELRRVMSEILREIIIAYADQFLLVSVNEFSDEALRYFVQAKTEHLR